MIEKLPVESVLDELATSLKEKHEAILQAPPGAGKTTLVPLKFLGQVEDKIIMLEPRRIAARNAALRMADILGEPVGQTVGYRMRLETKVSHKTRIEVVTEGVLIRMLQDDPGLEGIGMVIFDEFHERSLDADFGLSLTLKSRELFRDKPLKILLMSATLEHQRLNQFLDQAAVIQSEGQVFPVEFHYSAAAKPRERIVPRLLDQIRDTLKQHPTSSVLVFLPGEGEIRQLESLLAEEKHPGLDIAPLFGNLPIESQVLAIQPSQKPRRKIVLATNIAETSLTIDGIDVVVDSGLERRARFDPNTAMTRLNTQRISQASATQRAGRAGRLKPGHCYRLWSKEQQSQMVAQSTPEILEAELGDLVLQTLRFGFESRQDLDWLDIPPTAHWQQAQDQLEQLGALDTNQSSMTLTTHGEHMAQLSLSPRLSHMLITAKQLDCEDLGCALAALWSERDPFGRDEAFGVSVEARIELILGNQQCPARYKGWLHRVKTLATQFARQLRKINVDPKPNDLNQTDKIACLVTAAYPDRIARKRHGGAYQLANGRSAKLPDLAMASAMSQKKWLAASEVTGSAGGSDIIRSAIEFSPDLFDGTLSDLVRIHRVVDWDKKTARFVAEQQTRIGELMLKRQPLPDLLDSERVATICDYVTQKGLSLFKHHAKLQKLQRRCQILFAETQEETFDISDNQLLKHLETWLGPYLINQTKLDHITKLDIEKICFDQLSYEQKQKLEQFAPQTFKVPTGSNITIDYNEEPPVLAVKLQEMFGCDTTPTIANGSIALQVHLLSPAGRPLQITQDLHGFWRSSYQSVRKEMRGRYPKHPWPEDPTVAVPTRRTKRS